MNEFDLIARYFSFASEASSLNHCRGVELGIGDDAAVISPRGGKLVVATDALLEGVHFPPDYPAQYLASRLLSVNLSDFAAMGAQPKWLTLSISLPDVNESWLQAFSSSFQSLCTDNSLALVGGDTTKGPLSVSLTVIGEAKAGYLTRAGAAASDDVWVSGFLGEGAASLAMLTQGDAPLENPLESDWLIGEAERQQLLRAYHQPPPRLALGQALLGVASAAIDISDGLVADLSHIARQSDVCLSIQGDSLPVSPLLETYPDAEQVKRWVLAGGDEYELAFTAPSSQTGNIAQIGQQLALPLTKVGRVAEREASQPPVVIDGTGWSKLSAKGYSHF